MEQMKTNRFHACPILALLFLFACNIAVPTTVPTAKPKVESTATWTATQPPTPSATSTNTATPEPTIQRVIILSMDGLRPDAIELAPMPNLLDLMRSSAYSLTAQTVRPSATLPAHSSMLTGLCPSKHGVDWNDYLPQNGIAQGVDLFDLTHAAGMHDLMYVGKEKLQQVTDATNLDRFVYINDRDKVVMQNLLEDFPTEFDLLFIHFATTDDMGHVYGWLSPEQLSVIFRADEAIGELLSALDARGLRDETLLIFTADHGGHNLTHGTSMPEDMTIPWIVSGPGVQAGELTTPINITDTAATAAHALGLPVPVEWDGIPALEVFGIPAEPRPATICSR
jgi:predicted AlkP superfamily pyrophosphatase or phosphodiesterase